MTTDRTVALAFVPPAALGMVAFVAVVGVMGVDGFARALQEAGWFGPLALLAALMAVGVASVAMGLGLPRVIAMLAAVVPWAVAAVGAVWGMVRVASVLDVVDPLQRAQLFCAGYAETLAGRVVVAPVVAAIFVGVTVSALLRARVRADERWSMRALAALALVGAGFAIASATTAAVMHEGLGTLTVESVQQHALLGAAMNTDAELGRIVGLAIAALGGALLLVVVALASASRASIGGLGVAGCALALAPVLVLDVAHEAVATKAAHTGAHRPWRGVSDFLPLVLDDGVASDRTSSGDVLIVTRDAIVLGHDRVMTVSSTNVTSQDVRAYVATLASDVSGASGASGATGSPPDKPSEVRIAFDARAPAALVAGVLGVARDAEVELVEFVGVPHLGTAPGIAGVAAPTIERPVLLGCARAKANPRLGHNDADEKVVCIDARGADASELVRRFTPMRNAVIALALDASDAVHARPSQ